MPDAIPEALEIGAIITGLGGGLALFLFGMRQMTESLKTVAGNSMKNLLAKLTANRVTAAIAGAIITAVVQSSSVTTVLVVGFVSAGLLTLSQSIGVIIGANIGTTITGQIIAFQIYKYGLLMIAIGFVMDIAFKRENMKQYGMALMGLGLIFFGMELMSNATGPLQNWRPFVEAMQGMTSPFFTIGSGLVFTAITQSSSATTGIVIVLASQGLISLESGIGLCLGANIGTCVTALLSAIGRPREAVQAAWIHVVFNLGGVLLFVFFIPQLADLVRIVSPVSESLNAESRLAADTPRQIANAHTLFNVGNALLFIGFTGPLAKLVDRIVPGRARPKSIQGAFIDELYLEQPAFALDQVRRELVRLAELDLRMLQRSLDVVTRGSINAIDDLARNDNDVNQLYGAIVTYLGKLSQKSLVDPLPHRLRAFFGIANDLENIGDVVENDMLVEARKRARLGIVVSATTLSVLRPIHASVCQAFERMLDGLRDGDLKAAQEAIESKGSVKKLANEATAHLLTRLVATEPHRPAAFQIESGIIESLQRNNTLTRRIARALIELENGKSVPDDSVPAVSPE